MTLQSMGQNRPGSLRLKVSRKIAEIVAEGAPRDVRMEAARGALPLSGRDLLTVLFLLCSGSDAEIRQAAAASLKKLPVSLLAPVLKEADLDPLLLELIVRIRKTDSELIGLVIEHPRVCPAILLLLAETASAEILELLANQHLLLRQYPEIIEAMLGNPRVKPSLALRLGRPDAGGTPPLAVAGDDDDGAAEDDSGVDEEMFDEDQSKYQMSLHLKVAEKIKIGLTGDKEWRSLLIKDANKLVQGAVLKNPRITDGEVIMVAKNKQSSDEMIRLILLNKDWMKLYEIKKALVWHPKTPVPRALRLIGFLTLKDLKELARSRSVQTVISTTARKEMERKQKKA